jgi:AraC-like DNA-binding protein
MNQFALQQGHSRELDMFSHIVEFSLAKNNTIHLESFPLTTSENFRIYYVIDGKFEWIINQKHYVLYPGDLAIILPGQELGGSNRYLDIGTFIKLEFKVALLDSTNGINLGEWSNLTESERITVGRILLINNMSVLKTKEAGDVLYEMRSEVLNQEIGYLTRVNALLDTLRQANSRRDFPGTFALLEQALRKNLAHQWTVEEMAAHVGLGTTAFTEKVKTYTGFSPLNYLINIRISESIKLLKKADINVTQIALETGFYSSQHFSTTFKKLTGYTPGDFRKRNTPAK